MSTNNFFTAQYDVTKINTFKTVSIISFIISYNEYITTKPQAIIFEAWNKNFIDSWYIKSLYWVQIKPFKKQKNKDITGNTSYVNFLRKSLIKLKAKDIVYNK